MDGRKKNGWKNKLKAIGLLNFSKVADIIEMKFRNQYSYFCFIENCILIP